MRIGLVILRPLFVVPVHGFPCRVKREAGESQTLNSGAAPATVRKCEFINTPLGRTREGDELRLPSPETGQEQTSECVAGLRRAGGLSGF